LNFSYNEGWLNFGFIGQSEAWKRLVQSSLHIWNEID